MIPLTKPYIPESTYGKIVDVMGSSHLQGGGPFSLMSEYRLFEIVGNGKVKLAPSCTSALDLASLLIDLREGDEVIIPSFNFPSAALSVVNYGAIPIFVDIEEKTKCIMVEQIEEQITSKTRAISWVNYAGYAPDVDALRRISQKYGLFLIEDNAHALGSSSRGVKLGSQGDFAVYSFHATKNLQCGEGGAIQINNRKFWNQVEYMVEKGTNRFDYESGAINKYTWVEKGGSFLNSEILSTILFDQLELFDQIQQKRRYIYNTYLQEFKEFTQSLGFSGSFEEVDEEHAAHLFFLEFNNLEQRNLFISAMHSFEITTAFHYQALHNSAGGKKFGRDSGFLNNSIRAAQNLVRLPIYYDLENSQLEWIIECAKKVIKKLAASKQ